MQAFTPKPSQLCGTFTAPKQLLPSLVSVSTSRMRPTLLTNGVFTTQLIQQLAQQLQAQLLLLLLLLHARGRLSSQTAGVSYSMGRLCMWAQVLNSRRGLMGRSCPCLTLGCAPRYTLYCNPCFE